MQYYMQYIVAASIHSIWCISFVKRWCLIVSHILMSVMSTDFLHILLLRLPIVTVFSARMSYFYVLETVVEVKKSETV